MEQTLYKIAQTGKVQLWRIQGNPMTGMIIIEWGQQGGSLQIQTEVVKTNASNRNMREQVQLRLTSRVNKQKDKGYCETIELAWEREGLNAAGFIRPMLAQNFDDVKHIVDPDNCFMQRKYNGHRCLITKVNGEMIAYSRNGKLITSVPHILAELEPRLGDDMTVDGELYLHGSSIQKHSSLIKRLQPGSEKLKFIGYDLVSDTNYGNRLEQLAIMYAGLTAVELAPTLYPGVGSIQQEMERSKASGYEGLILRQAHYGYQAGGRSRALLKVKEYFDEEFEVIGIEPSADEWGVLVCKTLEGNVFKTSAPGTISDKKAALQNKHLYIGQMVQVEFFEWTEGRIPFHPRAIRWRNKADE